MRDDIARRRAARTDMHPHEAAERTVMADEWISNWADHPTCAEAEPRIQHVSHEDHVWRVVRPCHIVHPVIGGCADKASKFHKPPNPDIDRTVEIVRFRR